MPKTYSELPDTHTERKREQMNFFILFLSAVMFLTVNGKLPKTITKSQLKNVVKTMTIRSENCYCYNEYTYRIFHSTKDHCFLYYECGCTIIYNKYDGCCKKCSSCFPGNSRLQLDDGSVVQMKNLKTGHKVLTIQDGRRVFLEVKTFLRREPNKNTTHLTITTESGSSVTMSESHLIFVSGNNKSTDMVSRFASSVKAGDYVFTTKSYSRDLCPERVVQVSLSVEQGLYVPVTDTGTLVVDGVYSSCYAFVHHSLEHFILAPFRWFPWLLKPWQQDGYSPIISTMEYLGEIFLPQVVLNSGNR